MNIIKGIVISICCVAVCGVLILLGLALGADWGEVGDMVAPVIGLIAFLAFIIGGIIDR